MLESLPKELIGEIFSNFIDPHKFKINKVMHQKLNLALQDRKNLIIKSFMDGSDLPSEPITPFIFTHILRSALCQNNTELLENIVMHISDKPYWFIMNLPNNNKFEAFSYAYYGQIHELQRLLRNDTMTTIFSPKEMEFFRNYKGPMNFNIPSSIIAYQFQLLDILKLDNIKAQ